MAVPLLAALLAVMISSGGASLQANLSQPRQKPKRPCSIRGSRTLYRDMRVRVFAKDSDGGNLRIKEYGCLLGPNKRRLLVDCDEASYCYGIDLLAVRAPMVAYAIGSSYHGEDLGEWQVCVMDLRRGRERCSQSETTVGLGVNRAGSMAWMATGTTSFSVYELPARGQRPLLLDSGPEIDPRSFAVGGSYVYWMNGGHPHSARMP